MQTDWLLLLSEQHSKRDIASIIIIILIYRPRGISGLVESHRSSRAQNRLGIQIWHQVPSLYLEGKLWGSNDIVYINVLFKWKIKSKWKPNTYCCIYFQITLVRHNHIRMLPWELRYFPQTFSPNGTVHYKIKLNILGLKHYTTTVVFTSMMIL